MRKHFKGFTLVECLIALAVLGIASLTMAQIYAGVSKRNKDNNLVNTSLSNQMAYVEKYTDAETVKIYYGGSTTKDPNVNTTDKKPPHSGAGVSTNKNNFVTIVRVKSDGKTLDNDQTYSFPVDTFVLYSRDRNDKSSKDAGYTSQYSEDDYNLRYKYILGHKNS